MNNKHSGNPFVFSEIIKDLPSQFDKAITEMTKTAEMIGKAIKTNLDDFNYATSDDIPEASADDTTKVSSVDTPEAPADAAPEHSSVDTPEALSDNEENLSDQTGPESKSILSLNDMIALLEVNDAVDKLYDALETIVGSDAVSSNDLILKLNKIISVIVNASTDAKSQEKKEPQETGADGNEWIYQLLDDKTIDNEQKAQMLLGLRKH